MRIENEHHLVDAAQTNGALLRIHDKVGGLELITEPALADNFRVCMAPPGFQAA